MPTAFDVRFPSSKIEIEIVLTVSVLKRLWLKAFWRWL